MAEHVRLFTFYRDVQSWRMDRNRCPVVLYRDSVNRSVLFVIFYQHLKRIAGMCDRILLQDTCRSCRVIFMDQQCIFTCTTLVKNSWHLGLQYNAYWRTLPNYGNSYLLPSSWNHRKYRWTEIIPITWQVRCMWIFRKSCFQEKLICII
jgi:hypothetical protein